jgi:hypothetical protein
MDAAARSSQPHLIFATIGNLVMRELRFYGTKTVKAKN